MCNNMTVINCNITGNQGYNLAGGMNVLLSNDINIKESVFSKNINYDQYSGAMTIQKSENIQIE